MELPRYEAVGAPTGVKLAADDGGGGPAGVVDGLVANMSKDRVELRSGVEGGELSGTAYRLAIAKARKQCTEGSSSKSSTREERVGDPGGCYCANGQEDLELDSSVAFSAECNTNGGERQV